MSEDESGACQNLSASQKLSQQLSLSKARHLEEAAWGVVPGLLQELLTTERRVLLEITCAPDSRLTTTVQSLSSDSSAARCTGPWDGMDLSLDSGVRAALRLLETERPTHVWLAPPVGPYCTLQNANAQNPQQAETLQRKREAAMRAYVGACVIFHACVQQGIHVTLEMSERCQAWRLPLFQRLQSKYQLYSAVTKGCRVGLRSSSEGPLMQKGWKILTTQKRLASLLHLGCHCPKSYKHGRCEGASTGRSDTYTSEYTRRAAKAILQELDHTTVAQECHGTSVLPVQFGEGLCCTCSEVHLPGRPRQCAFCLGSKPEDTEGPNISSETPEHPEADDSTSGSPSVGPEASDSALYSQVELSQLEQHARQLRQGKDYSHQACNTLLEMFPGSSDETSSHGPGMDPRKYITFGLYSHGNHYGITRVTRQLSQVIRYLLEYFKHWAGSLPVATSLVVNLNQRCDKHRDVHNDKAYDNWMIGVSEYQGGRLWVENISPPEPGNPESGALEALPNGEQRRGHWLATQHQVAHFPPKAWHGPESWKGRRNTVCLYVSRGHGLVGSDVRKELQNCGFRLPRRSDSALTNDTPSVGSRSRAASAP